MFRKIASYTYITLILGLASCTAIDDPNSGSSIAPIITLDSENSIYTTKVGESITISPTYEHLDESSTFAWQLSGEVIGYDSTLCYSSDEVGSYYINLTVTNSAGDDQVELRIDVAALTPPTISLPTISESNKIIQGTTLSFSPVVTSSLSVTYLWTIDGSEVSTDKDFSFTGSEVGTYDFSFSAQNSDGEASIDFSVEVCDPSEIGFSWAKEQEEYNVSVGRTIRIRMVDVIASSDLEYSWLRGGEVLCTTSSPSFSYTALEEGRDTITVLTSINEIPFSEDIFVNICPKEGTYYRASSSASSPYSNKVYEYRPAPGQFINATDSFSTMDEATAYAEERFATESYLSLGGFGGYVVVGFDHSINVSDGYNLAVKGNAFSGSSEAGIVWVMQDENGDGVPNDTWYELQGSEYNAAGTIFDYEVTYYRPSGAGLDTPWTDNLGGSGTIDCNSSHSQDYYYPTWIAEDSYTLRGSRLEARCEDTSGSGFSWVLGSYDWGYADNYNEIDYTDSSNTFTLSRAVRFDGESADLKYIDFVKVQNGINFKCGWLGEVSTEVCGFLDIN